MTEYQFERACDINYALERYEEALDVLKDSAHYSLKVVRENSNSDMSGRIVPQIMIIDNSATDFIREMIEEHTEKLVEEIQARINKLKKEIEEL